MFFNNGKPFGLSFFRHMKSYTVLKPFVDYENRLSQIDLLKLNLKRRKLNPNIEELSTLYEKLRHLEGVKTQLENQRQVIKQSLNKLLKTECNTDAERQLKTTAKIVREDYKQIKSTVLDVEQSLIAKIMKLPNSLHHRTSDEDTILHSFLDVEKTGKSHLEIGRLLNNLEYRSPTAYFLKNDAALFEINSISKFSDFLEKEHFVGFSNPDFSRTIIIEGCEGVYNSCLPLTKSEDDQDVLYVSGGASALPFFSYFAKTKLSAVDLPLRCFSSGRQYLFDQDPEPRGLYNVVQSNALQVFVLTNPEQEDAELDYLIDITTKLYQTFDVPFRVVMKGASHLKTAESLRVVFEVYSPHFKSFNECGHISMYGSHLSKNMNIYCESDQLQFVSVLSGSVIRAAPLIACMLENDKSLNKC